MRVRYVVTLTLAAVGCTAPGEPEPVPVETAVTADGTTEPLHSEGEATGGSPEAETSTPVEAMGSPEPAAQATEPADTVESTDDAVIDAYWRDAEFREQFAQRYLAHTEVEPPPLNADELLIMGEVSELMGAEDAEGALLLLNEARTDEANALLDYTAGQLHYQLEQTEEALEAYRVATAKFPKYLNAWQGLGHTLHRLGNYEDAIDGLTEVIQLGGGDSYTYGALGIAYSSKSQFLPAETAFRTAILLAPDRIDWRKGLAQTLVSQKRYAEAISMFEAMIEQDPDTQGLWMSRAYAYLGAGDQLKAAENFEVAELLGDIDQDSLHLLGGIYTNAQLYDLATDAFLRAMKLTPEGYREKALASAGNLAARGATEDATRLILEIESQYSAELEAEEQAEILRMRARLARDGGATDEQIRLLHEVVDLAPLDGSAMLTLGRHYRFNDDPAQAILLFERAAGLKDFEIDAKWEHAQVLIGQEKYAESLILLRDVQASEHKKRENAKQLIPQVERMSQASGQAE